MNTAPLLLDEAGDASTTLMMSHHGFRRDLARFTARLTASAGGTTKVIVELRALLDAHLATEEAEIIPHMRTWKTFPSPGSTEEVEMYAQGLLGPPPASHQRCCSG